MGNENEDFEIMVDEVPEERPPVTPLPIIVGDVVVEQNPKPKPPQKPPSS